MFTPIVFYMIYTSNVLYSIVYCFGVDMLTEPSPFAHIEPLLKITWNFKDSKLYLLGILKFHFNLRHLNVPCYFIKYLDIFNDTCNNYNLRKIT